MKRIFKTALVCLVFTYFDHIFRAIWNNFNQLPLADLLKLIGNEIISIVILKDALALFILYYAIKYFSNKI